MKSLAPILLLLVLCSAILVGPVPIVAEEAPPKRVAFLEKAIDALSAKVARLARAVGDEEALERLEEVKPLVDEFKGLVAEGRYQEAWRVGRRALAELGRLLRGLFEHAELRAKVEELAHRAPRAEVALLRAMEAVAERSNATFVLPLLRKVKECIEEGNYAEARRLIAECAVELRRRAAESTAQRAIKFTERMFARLNYAIKAEPAEGIDAAISSIEASMERLERVAEHLEAVNASPVAVEAIEAAIMHMEAVVEHLKAVKELVEVAPIKVALPPRLAVKLSELAEGVVEEVEGLIEEAREEGVPVPAELVEGFEGLKAELLLALEQGDLTKARSTLRELVEVRAQLHKLVAKAECLERLYEEAESLVERLEGLIEEGRRPPIPVSLELLKEELEEAKARGELGRLRELIEELEEAFNLPDLVASLKLEGEVAVGEVVNATVVVRNEGSVASSATTLEVSLNGEVVAAIDVPELEPGASATFTVPISVEASGSYSLRVEVDPANVVEEVDEADNVAELTIEVGGGRYGGPMGWPMSWP